MGFWIAEPGYSAIARQLFFGVVLRYSRSADSSMRAITLPEGMKAEDSIFA
jgi:hypothetical protein